MWASGQQWAGGEEPLSPLDGACIIQFTSASTMSLHLSTLPACGSVNISICSHPHSFSPWNIMAIARILRLDVHICGPATQWALGVNVKQSNCRWQLYRGMSFSVGAHFNPSSKKCSSCICRDCTAWREQLDWWRSESTTHTQLSVNLLWVGGVCVNVIELGSPVALKM